MTAPHAGPGHSRRRLARPATVLIITENNNRPYAVLTDIRRHPAVAAATWISEHQYWHTRTDLPVADVAVIDYRCAERIIPHLRAAAPDTKLMLWIHPQNISNPRRRRLLLRSTVFTRAVAAGVDGFVAWPRHIQRSNTAGLTARQLQVVECAALGLTNNEIGQRLGIDASAVKSHLQYAFQHLHVTGRDGAVGELFRRGVLN